MHYEKPWSMFSIWRPNLTGGCYKRDLENLCGFLKRYSMFLKITLGFRLIPFKLNPLYAIPGVHALALR